MPLPKRKIFPYLGVKELRSKRNLANCLISEFIGVFFLVFVGCGSCLSSESVDVVRISLAFGVIVATMVQAVGHVSGGHINPAVTVGMLIARKIGIIKATLYILVQCVGAIAGAAVLQVFSSEDVSGYEGLGMTLVSGNISPAQALGIEFFITCVLVLVVFAVAGDDNNASSVKGSAPLAIGLAIATGHLYAVPLTGSSMNPARSFGPAVILGAWENHWVYWAGPVLAGVASALVYQIFMRAPARELIVKEEYAVVATKENNEEEKNEA